MDIDKNLDKKWLWIPFVGLCIVVILLLLLEVPAIVSELSGPDSFWMGLVVPPVMAISLIVLVVHSIANRYRKGHLDVTELGNNTYSVSKLGIVVVGLLMLLILLICIVYLLH